MARIIFMGTPEFAVPTLQALIDHHNVLAVVTQPDRPAGRKNILTPPPIKILAQAHGIPVFQPERIRRPDAIEQLKGYGAADAFVVAAFGQILPQTVLDLPRYGSINVHASLLPRWRGAAPIAASLRAGDAETGITIMKMDAGLDTGPWLTMRATPITPDDTGQTLHDRLAQIGADLLIETLPGYFDGSITPQAQDDSRATFAPRMQKEDGRIDWQQPADAIERTVRAFTPWPGTYTHWKDSVLKILAGKASADAVNGQPGDVILHAGKPAVITGAGLFMPSQVQLPGKKPMEIDAFLNGYPDFIGAQLS